MIRWIDAKRILCPPERRIIYGEVNTAARCQMNRRVPRRECAARQVWKTIIVKTGLRVSRSRRYFSTLARRHVFAPSNRKISYVSISVRTEARKTFLFFFFAGNKNDRRTNFNRGSVYGFSTNRRRSGFNPFSPIKF